MKTPTVSRADYPPKKNWPKDGWQHALNSDRFSHGDVFGWWDEAGRLWTGIVEDRGPFCVKVRDVMPGVLET